MGRKPRRSLWTNHPCCVMWKGYENALKEYLNVSIDVWKARGRNNKLFNI